MNAKKRIGDKVCVIGGYKMYLLKSYSAEN